MNTMKTKDILIAAIKQAVNNGYKDPEIDYELGYVLDSKHYYSIIFDLKFAEAFWAVPGTKSSMHFLEHLKIMVAYEEPLKYIEKFIK